MSPSYLPNSGDNCKKPLLKKKKQLKTELFKMYIFKEIPYKARCYLLSQ